MSEKEYNTLLISDHLEQAAETIRRGELVGVPTETVYGLAANGLSSDAVKKIYEVKGRPKVKALSLMVPGEEAIERYCEDVPPVARDLAAKYWPGPLTLILRAKRRVVPRIVRAGGKTVGLRCPDHPLTLELLKKADLPLAAPSANPSGEPSPKDAQQVRGYFDGKIDAIIDEAEGTTVTAARYGFQLMRLLAKDDSRLRLKRKATGGVAIDLPLTQYIAQVSVLYSLYGHPLTVQEYLDRQDFHTFVFYLSKENDDMLAMLRINNWIVRLDDDINLRDEK